MKADWEVIEDKEVLERLTGASVDVEWTAVAIPTIEGARAVLAAANKGDRVWAFIDILRPIGSLSLVKAVKDFHACLQGGGMTTVYGIRAPHVPARWMEWLGARKTDETVNDEEVWVWLN